MELQDLQFSTQAFTDSAAGEEYWHSYLKKSGHPVLARLIPLSPQSHFWVNEPHRDTRSPALMQSLGYISKPQECQYLVLLSEEAVCNLASDIAERQRQGGRYELAEIVAILERCVEGLTAICSSQSGAKGHGNLTPSSVFRSSDGSYKLGNFCSVMANVRSYDGPYRAYIHPQVLKGRTAALWQVDCYDLGVLLLHLCELQEPLGVNAELSTAEQCKVRFYQAPPVYQNKELLQLFTYLMQANPHSMHEHFQRTAELLRQVKLVAAALSPSINQYRAVFHPVRGPDSYTLEKPCFPGTVSEGRAEWLCSVCIAATAACFCNCEGRETFLCHYCFPVHSSKYPRKVHFAISIAAYGQHKLPGYFERLQRRSAYIPIATSEIRKNIDEIDKSIAEVSSGIQSVVAAINDYGERVIAQLQQLKSELEREISDSIAEVENTMHQDSPVLRNPMAKAIREFSGDTSRLLFFTFTIDTTQVIEDIQSICSFATTRPRDNEYSLPGLQGNRLVVFHVDRNGYSTTVLPSAFSTGCRLCCIDGCEVLLVGAKPASAEAATVVVSSGQVTALAQMHTARSFPGLILVEKCVFIFGGECVECEKYDVRSRAWISLRSMRYAKSSLSPCRHLHQIYLIDVPTPVESFHLNSERFRLLQVDFYGLTGYSLCAYSDGDIVIVTNFGRMGRWRPEATAVEVAECRGVGASSQCPPLTFRNEIYFVGADNGNLLSFNLHDRTIARK